MGGQGSGNWYRYGRKSAVEESLVVDISGFRGRLVPNYSGTVTWSWAGGCEASIGYFVTWDDVQTLTLSYRWRDNQDVRIPVRLQTTPAHFGGRRWWFTCPLVTDDVACNRRISKLYQPPGARYFGCRTCHRLTYQSCQEAHRGERVFGELAQDLGFDPELGKLAAAQIKAAARLAGHS